MVNILKYLFICVLVLFVAPAVFTVVFKASPVPTAFGADPAQLVFVFQKQKNPASIRSEADRISEYLTSEIGLSVRSQVPSDYGASVQALVSKKADFAYVDSVAFLLARRDGDAELLLAEQRKDSKGVFRTDYDSVFVVRKENPIQSMEDIVANAKKLAMVFTSPTSTSGYIMAYKRLVDEGLLEAKQDPKTVFKSVSFGGSYTQALEQILTGRGDVCAVSYYAIEGEGAAKYLPEEKRSKLRIVARTPGVPTHVIVARGGLSPELKLKVKNALLKLSNEKPELLADVYGTSKLVEVNEDSHVRATAQAVEYLGLPVEGLMKKRKS